MTLVRPGSGSGSGSQAVPGQNVVVIVPPTPSDSINVYGATNLTVAYHHKQGISSTTWAIVHNLGFYPNITCMDSGGSVAEGEISYDSVNELQVTFSAPISGDAYLS